mmetsp:Transcript_12153/g.34851  ORF Transcript_12153/g.34851 Transcript_12153/m.34851 type:complete len:289 (+) Transcript_12153:91-957(+)
MEANRVRQGRCRCPARWARARGSGGGREEGEVGCSVEEEGLAGVPMLRARPEVQRRGQRPQGRLRFVLVEHLEALARVRGPTDVALDARRHDELHVPVADLARPQLHPGAVLGGVVHAVVYVHAESRVRSPTDEARPGGRQAEDHIGVAALRGALPELDGAPAQVLAATDIEAEVRVLPPTDRGGGQGNTHLQPGRGVRRSVPDATEADVENASVLGHVLDILAQLLGPLPRGRLAIGHLPRGFCRIVGGDRHLVATRDEERRLGLHRGAGVAARKDLLGGVVHDIAV